MAPTTTFSVNDDLSDDAESLLRHIDEFTFSSGTPIRLSDRKKPLQVRTNAASSSSPAQSSAAFTNKAVVFDEKEEARQWATKMRAAVDVWVREQKALIECEKQQLLDQQESYRQAVQKLERERQEMQKKRSENEASFRKAMEKHWENERKFQAIIDCQQEQIAALQHQLSAQRQTHKHEAKSSLFSKSFLGKKVEKLTPHVIKSPPEAVSPTAAAASSSNNGQDHPEQQQQHRHRELLSDGTQIIQYGNGTVKEKLSDGSTIIRFSNGDIQTQATDSTVAYYFHKTKVTKITPVDGSGSTIYRFPNGQVERHFADGHKRVQFPDGSVQTVFASGSSELRDDETLA